METEKKIILIVDDNQINRGILANILSGEYYTAEAENGQAAFEALDREPDIAAILLDIVMPVMDGYAFLKKLPETPYANLPVLVLTGSSDADSEQRVLEQGAWDFVPKPYSPKVLLSRLKNAITKSQLYLLEQMKYVNEHDALTGLYNRAKYFTETRRMLERHPRVQFALVCFNINRFRALNSFWGEQGGNHFLQYVANVLREIAAGFDACTFGRIESDIFSMCHPYDAQVIQRHTEFVTKKLREYKQDYLVEASFGVFVIEEPAMDVGTMYARAALAVAVCKKEYTPLCYYRPEMSEAVRMEQRIINEMQQALDERQFLVYLQPKYDLKTDLPYGAEALIRWQHPTRGLISPGVFIPVFERNGFIGKVDYYMWEQVCCLLRKWMDAGITPAPISVNVSRVNLYNPKLVENIAALAEKYSIPPRLLNLEITESAYMENPFVMQDVVKALHEKGFLIMMDDFGSGYSSLNTLKNIQIDVLKIDMKFLSADERSGRGARILASVIRMAGWLELPVIVEGVETAQQRDFLESIGCGYVQGYYYAKPMPVPEYEALIQGIAPSPAQALPESIENVAETLWSANPQIELLFKSIRQPVVIFEYDRENFRALRVNGQYNLEFGYGENALEWNAACMGHVAPETLQRLRAAFRDAIQCKGASSCDYPRIEADGTQKWYHLDLQYWAANGNAAILFAMFRDIAELKK